MKSEILSRDGLKTVALNRRRAVRERCLNCSGWSNQEVEGCTFTDCSLYPYRSGQGGQNAKDRNQAIKSYCQWCMAGDKWEIKRCTSAHCPLFHFRGSKMALNRPALLTKGHIERFAEANNENV